jgi:nucleoside-diphosphate-sugar epimerase
MTVRRHDGHLVTGALGCIGAWVVRQLLDDGERVVALDAGGSDHRLVQILPSIEHFRAHRTTVASAAS